MQTIFELVEFIEHVFGLANALLGMTMVLYIAKALRSHQAKDNKKIVSFVKYSLFAVLFLSFYSLFHFVREIFDLKERYGSFAELPEYIFVFFVYIIFVWRGITFYFSY